ncbi:hypothetical protein EVAR_24986_1 [Eumeta japonica]|uniref:Uncharacterized protein n=1 Tax=Eumeta variegata TaxID=151549 RepID=A0A4C1XG16_EUMVA|nr:hypothetical protein EVAR_24986_1 [Eumeta japonica]
MAKDDCYNVGEWRRGSAGESERDIYGEWRGAAAATASAARIPAARKATARPRAPTAAAERALPPRRRSRIVPRARRSSTLITLFKLNDNRASRLDVAFDRRDVFQLSGAHVERRGDSLGGGGGRWGARDAVAGAAGARRVATAATASEQCRDGGRGVRSASLRRHA